MHLVRSRNKNGSLCRMVKCDESAFIYMGKLQHFFSTNFHLFNLVFFLNRLFNAANILNCLNGEFVSCMGNQEIKRWSSDNNKKGGSSRESNPRTHYRHTHKYIHICLPICSVPRQNPSCSMIVWSNVLLK